MDKNVERGPGRGLLQGEGDQVWGHQVAGKPPKLGFVHRRAKKLYLPLTKYDDTGLEAGTGT